MLVITEKCPNFNNKRNFTNKPEVRFDNILNELKNNSNYKIIQNNKLINLDELKKLKVHNDLMLNFLSNCYNSFDQYIKSYPNDNTFGNEIDGIIPYNITKNELDENIIKNIEYFRQIGLWASDTITPIFSNTFTQSLTSASNGWVVPEFIQNGYNRIYCLNINPGHHASSNRYAGYCYLNNGAICCKSIQSNPNLKYNKIAILDLDYHAGDGTSEIFADDNNVLTISIHINPLYDYPFYSCFNDEYTSYDDIDLNNKTNYNFTFEPKCDLNQYLVNIKKSMEIINKFNPDCLIIAFGGDTYKDDLDALEPNRTLIGIDDYYKIGNEINFRWSSSKPIIVTQEGGYNMEKIGLIVKSFLLGLE